jgi:NADH:ubiquinone oxidoreductase subunit F (NADH-binding)
VTAPAQPLLPGQAIESLAAYVDAGGLAGLERALAIGPAAVVEEIRASGLRGRGGAGFPTGVKWASVAEGAAGGLTTYAVCNAAEGEPGTFKDRTLMARNPYQVLEGLLVAAYAVGAERAYVAVKERFHTEVGRLVDARDELADAGWRGAAELRVVPGPDEYLFGEEKAMLEVIEGKLPLPRILPPYQIGLFATMTSPNPTVVNNVETLANVPRILARGAQAFRAVGTEESPGTMLFTAVGDVANPGVYELPLGTPLRTLLCDIAGADAARIKAVYSGTSNTVITPDLLDLPMDFDSFAEAGTGLGSGGFVVYDSSRCIVQVTATLARFLAIESCGQCLACKLGTAEIHDRLARLVAGEGTATDIEEIRKRTDTVTDQNRCYLPVGAALLVRSTLEAFGEEFRARVGSPSPAGRAVGVPKIVALDEDTGDVAFDPDYDRKRGDWSYEPE